MDCERAKGLIIDLLYDELSSETASELQEHLTGCESCSRYKEELQHTLGYLDRVEDLQAPVDLAALHDAVDRKRHRVKRFLRRRWPVWVTIGGCGAMLLMFALFVSEIRYENNALTIRFSEQEAETLAEENQRTLVAYREEQLLSQKKLTDELRAATAILLEVIDEYESHRNRQMVGAFRQVQRQQNLMLLATRKELESLASQTEERLKKNYLMTMATVAGLVDTP